jgi:hypothetical protein
MGLLAPRTCRLATGCHRRRRDIAGRSIARLLRYAGIGRCAGKARPVPRTCFGRGTRAPHIGRCVTGAFGTSTSPGTTTPMHSQRRRVGPLSCRCPSARRFGAKAPPCCRLRVRGSDGAGEEADEDQEAVPRWQRMSTARAGRRCTGGSGRLREASARAPVPHECRSLRRSGWPLTWPGRMGLTGGWTAGPVRALGVPRRAHHCETRTGAGALLTACEVSGSAERRRTLGHGCGVADRPCPAGLAVLAAARGRRSSGKAWARWVQRQACA